MEAALVTKEPEGMRSKALAAGWAEVDADWLEKQVAEPFQPIALKYGRMCFSMVMQTGSISYALGNIAGQMKAMGAQTQRLVGQGLQVVQKITNDFVIRILLDSKIEQATFNACKVEIEQIGQLSMQSPSPSRLILPN